MINITMFSILVAVVFLSELNVYMWLTKEL